MNWDKKLIKTNREFPTILYNKYITKARENTEKQGEIDTMVYKRNPFSCTLKIPTRKKIVLISTHLAFTDTRQRQKELEKLPNLLSLHDSMSHVILLGDFNTGPDKLDDAIKSTSHECVLPEGTTTNTAGTKSFDNILVSSTDREHIKYWSIGSIITCKGLTAKDVSNHLPIFVDMDIC